VHAINPLILALPRRGNTSGARVKKTLLNELYQALEKLLGISATRITGIDVQGSDIESDDGVTLLQDNDLLHVDFCEVPIQLLKDDEKDAQEALISLAR